jgi:hypothetical protein
VKEAGLDPGPPLRLERRGSSPSMPSLAGPKSVTDGHTESGGLTAKNSATARLRKAGTAATGACKTAVKEATSCITGTVRQYREGRAKRKAEKGVRLDQVYVPHEGYDSYSGGD